MPFAVGRAIGSRVALIGELRGNAQRLEREQQERARHAAEEPNRVARELHDVVGHGVSVMVIQTQAARRVAVNDRKAARDALSSVQLLGKAVQVPKSSRARLEHARAMTDLGAALRRAGQGTESR